MGKYCLHIYIKFQQFKCLKLTKSSVLVTHWVHCRSHLVPALTCHLMSDTGTDLPSVNIVFLAPPDPATDPRHRLNQADQHPLSSVPLNISDQHPLSSVPLNISPISLHLTAAWHCQHWENNYLKQIFNYVKKDKNFSAEDILFSLSALLPLISTSLLDITLF